VDFRYDAAHLLVKIAMLMDGKIAGIFFRRLST